MVTMVTMVTMVSMVSMVTMQILGRISVERKPYKHRRPL